MLYISKPEIQKIFSMKDAIEASKQALAMYTDKKCIVPLRLNIPVVKNKGQTLVMPSYIEPLNATGIKVVSVYPDNAKIDKPSLHAQLILLDSTTGEVIAIIDGTYVTQLRTGALQGAATDLLARKDAKVGCLIGTGGQAAAQLEAMLTVRDLSEVKIASKDFKHAQLFVNNMQHEFSRFKTKLIAVRDSAEAMQDADIITTITTSSAPVFNNEFVKDGVHINAMGGYTATMQEVPSEAMSRAGKIYTDTNDGVLSEAGDVIIPLTNGLITQKHITGELGDLLLGNKLGRTSNSEITIFKSVGSAVLDTVVGHMIYMKAKYASA